MRRRKGEQGRVLLAMAWVLFLFAGRAAAQGVVVESGVTIRDDRDLLSVRGGYWMPLAAPFGVQLFGSYVYDLDPPPNESVVRRYGAGGQLDLFRDERGPFLLGSLEGGVETGGPDDAWASWTAGVGYAVPVIGLQLILDARWRGFLSGEPGGVQIGLGLGLGSVGRRGRGKVQTEQAARATPTGATGTSTTVATGGGAQRRSEIVATARQVMGQPYRYGGEGDGGFDCSGLIQYAYASHGVTMPRVSTDQAQVGDAVARALDELEPGDILTFTMSPGGTRVSHVGLYVGEGRFIHSASSRGVSESRLSADDPNGAWWYARWVGARRIIVDP